MFQAYDKYSTTAVLPAPCPTESDIYEQLEKLYKKRLEGSARGRKLLEGNYEPRRADLDRVYDIKYAVGYWIQIENCSSYPEEEMNLVFKLAKSRMNVAGIYDPANGIFFDNKGREYEIEEIASFFILPNDPIEE